MKTNFPYMAPSIYETAPHADDLKPLNPYIYQLLRSILIKKQQNNIKKQQDNTKNNIFNIKTTELALIQKDKACMYVYTGLLSKEMLKMSYTFGKIADNKVKMRQLSTIMYKDGKEKSIASEHKSWLIRAKILDFTTKTYVNTRMLRSKDRE